MALIFNWNTIPQVDAYQISAYELSTFGRVFRSGDIVAVYPSMVATLLPGTYGANGSYYISVSAQRDATVGRFRHEFASETAMIHPQLVAAETVGAFRPSDGTFYLDYNGSGTWNGCGTDRCLQIGMSGDTPLVGKW